MKIRLSSIVAVAACTVILAVAILAGVYRKTETIGITDRYWRWDVSVKYDVVWDTTDQSCTGTGKDRKCSYTTTRHIDTRTRCAGYATGKELPPQRPDVPCWMILGDYIREDVMYHAVDRIDRTFPLALWDYLEPGYTRIVTVNVFGNITGKGSE